MARFIRVPTGDDRIVLVNTEMVEVAIGCIGEDDLFFVKLWDKDGEMIEEASFDTKEEMEAFLDANFLLFNK